MEDQRVEMKMTEALLLASELERSENVLLALKVQDGLRKLKLLNQILELRKSVEEQQYRARVQQQVQNTQQSVSQPQQKQQKVKQPQQSVSQQKQEQKDIETLDLTEEEEELDEEDDSLKFFDEE